MNDVVTLDDGTRVETFDHGADEPDPLFEPLADVRDYVDPADDVDQLDRIETKLDAILAGADALREATEPLIASMGSGGGLLSLLGGMMGGR